ncbi:hypothetical protein FA10DRAFT_41075 [Acaromyces ingoldii]|uniref:Uncharacterized protein n=1 Tax=Acaromyces ingoldii TaxID=215250 RepID=A0A316YZ93_9BASI|nr:hypothetical protein FA10DRAFT_41075 [Acaromyces ingoldii]PWN94084.1 hypothetical protein FA10DRAFT_41075 [Acaromyces ingoldii]
MARWRLRIQTGVLVIQYLLYALFLVHFIYRFIHDLFLAALGWTHRQDRTCEPAAGQTIFVTSQQQTVLARPIDWSQLHEAAGEGVNGAAAFWLLFVLPLFIAVLLLMAANLPCYVGAVPLPDPCPDTVRYKLCYNEESQKMEFQRVDHAGGPRLPSGEPLYELVRDKDGEGWAVREATVSTIPVFDHITFSPWYR